MGALAAQLLVPRKRACTSCEWDNGDKLLYVAVGMGAVLFTSTVRVAHSIVPAVLIVRYSTWCAWGAALYSTTSHTQPISLPRLETLYTHLVNSCTTTQNHCIPPLHSFKRAQCQFLQGSNVARLQHMTKVLLSPSGRCTCSGPDTCLHTLLAFVKLLSNATHLLLRDRQRARLFTQDALPWLPRRVRGVQLRA